MNDDTAKNTEDDVWPPPPTFRPGITKPIRSLPPLWVVLAINTGGDLLYSVYRAWHFWHMHQKMDWWEIAYPGLFMFVFTTALQIWLRHRIVHHNGNLNGF